jgi:16S rRNA (guanine527-N7)-methyltransferase
LTPEDEWGELSLAGADKLRELIETLARDPSAPSSVRNPDQARKVHIADSLSGLGIEELKSARHIGDVGSGAGFPGLVLAAALPQAHVDLIESNGRKCEFMRRAAADARIDNARVVCERAETWAAARPPDGGRESYDAVTARAVGRLAELAELASPLLRDGGVLVAWKGRRDVDEEAEAGRAAERLAMAPVETRWVGPYAGSENRHLHVSRKSGPTPRGLPRRPGMAKKRPFGAA